MKILSVLVIDDDKGMVNLVTAAFEAAGHAVRSAGTLLEGRRLLEDSRPDLLVLDRGLPDGDGVKLCLELRRDSRYRDLPILMLTGKSETVDKVLGLRFGADDYLPKPFDVEELLARADALIRRAMPGLSGYSPRLHCGPITLDTGSRAVTVEGNEIDLTPTEFDLLRLLMERAGAPLERAFLLETVWKSAGTRVAEKTVDVTVMNLRRKLGQAAAVIEAVRGCGYMARDPGRDNALPPVTRR